MNHVNKRHVKKDKVDVQGILFTDDDLLEKARKLESLLESKVS